MLCSFSRAGRRFSSESFQISRTSGTNWLWSSTTSESHSWCNFRSELTVEQLSCVDLIDECLSRMSKGYCDEAVSNSPEWQHIRRLAAEALNAFGWPLEDPPNYAHEFVRRS
jgi:hypothetical protein